MTLQPSRLGSGGEPTLEGESGIKLKGYKKFKKAGKPFAYGAVQPYQ